MVLPFTNRSPDCAIHIKYSKLEHHNRYKNNNINSQIDSNQTIKNAPSSFLKTEWSVLKYITIVWSREESSKRIIMKVYDSLIPNSTCIYTCNFFKELPFSF